jgi:hypothetical protein
MSKKGALIPEPIYTTFDSVKVRLTGKVQFQQDCDRLENGELPDLLLAQLVSDAETAVEQDLRTRYTVPFQSLTTQRWADLPDHTKRAVRRAIDMRCVMEVLRTDFGRGSHDDADDYYNGQANEYKSYIKVLLGQDAEGKDRKMFRFSPPLQDLLLAPTNRADDGYRGMIINTDTNHHGAEEYAKEQINNPADSYVGRRRFIP